ncbi:hypothetical protein ASC64_17455 [Nocardioides sp. Root122]|uniref:hypothetical protein n=1 Tax=Nocardioides TaxID=1839 RepID=UPI000703A4AF|nr:MULTISPECIES: hypothetical protein [Nocardioides]KQV63380.1 hypothetical protein ASC64_17455 [Nocardioides sp. Root122]MCK9825517.1 hypothetical protein [Nocardioides cavernae]
MAARLQSLTIVSADPERLASFWRELLGPSGEVGLNQIHVHLSSNAASQEDTVARALADPDGNEFRLRG